MSTASRESHQKEVLLTFYGDDLTGTISTAAALIANGVPTIVFAKPPSAAFVAEHFPQVRAVGVAGRSRALSIAEMEEILPPVFNALRDFQAPVFLYKVCSTFDSSEKIGSIGKAIEIGRQVFPSFVIPVLPAAPKFGRFTVFGNHFATLGGDSVYRLDRHPSMSNHPVTPMSESDLRLHLGKQTSLGSGSIDVLDLESGQEHVESLLDKFCAASTPLVFFDCLFERHLMLACQVIWQRSALEESIFIVGSHELGHGLSRAWLEAGLLAADQTNMESQSVSDAGPLFVLSGSCAAVTGEQILWALENGFANIPIEVSRLLNKETRNHEQERVVQTALSAIRQTTSVVAHTAIGPGDPRIELAQKGLVIHSCDYGRANELVGQALGEIARQVIRLSNIKRLVIAGGDTSGAVLEHLGFLALQVANFSDPVSPLCYLFSSAAEINGLEIAFKGGQVGSADYFGKMQTAQIPEFKTTVLGNSEIFSSISL